MGRKEVSLKRDVLGSGSYCKRDYRTHGDVGAARVSGVGVNTPTLH